MGPGPGPGAGPGLLLRGAGKASEAMEIAPQARKEAEGRLNEGRCPGRLQAPRASTRRRPKANVVTVRPGLLALASWLWPLGLGLLALALRAEPGTLPKDGFVMDLASHGSKWRTEGTIRSRITSRSFLEGRIPAGGSKMGRTKIGIWGGVGRVGVPALRADATAVVEAARSASPRPHSLETARHCDSRPHGPTGAPSLYLSFYLLCMK